MACGQNSRDCVGRGERGSDGAGDDFACTGGSQPTGGDFVGRGVQKGIATRFAGWHDPIPAVLAATPVDTLLRHPIYHLATPLPTYVGGRVVLLGDAAHAMTPDLGQGACQALEDAVVLATHPSDATELTGALAAYDRARRMRSQDLVRASARVARLVNTRKPLTSWLRDVVAWALPTAAFMRATDDAFGWCPPARPDPARTARMGRPE